MRGRIRTIKPEALTDEDLWDLETETGMPLFRAFVGLWTQADREGRFEWRPRPLKAAVLPYWEGDFSRVLDALATRGFVVKYAHAGREYGVVRTFTKHQVVNNRESASELPDPDDADGVGPENTPDPTRAPRVTDACPTPLVHAHGEGKGREGKGTEGKEGTAPPRAAGAPLALVAPAKPPRKREGTSKSTPVWNAYAEAYLERYGVEPVRNAKVNAQLSRVVDRLGADDAPHVAAWFVAHNRPYYVSRGHPVGALEADCEALRTQWARGRPITSSDAREAETEDNMRAQSARIEALLRADGIEP